MEHLFATLSPTTVLAIVSSRGDNPVVLPNVTTTLGGADRNEFEDMVFPARLRVGEENRRDLDLSRTFAKVAEMVKPCTFFFILHEDQVKHLTFHSFLYLSTPTSWS